MEHTLVNELYHWRRAGPGTTARRRAVHALERHIAANWATSSAATRALMVEIMVEVPSVQWLDLLAQARRQPSEHELLLTHEDHVRESVALAQAERDGLTVSAAE